MSDSAFPAAFAERFKDLKTIQIPAAPLTDDDIEFQSDMSYMRDLLHAIVMQASHGGHCSPWPDDLSTHLKWIEDQFNG